MDTCDDATRLPVSREILLVVDDCLLRSKLLRLLEGVAPVVCADDCSALARLCHVEHIPAPFSLIIIDSANVSCPDLRALLMLLTSSPSADVRNIPVLVVCPPCSKAAQRRLSDFGAHGVLKTSLSKDAIVECVRGMAHLDHPCRCRSNMVAPDTALNALHSMDHDDCLAALRNRRRDSLRNSRKHCSMPSAAVGLQLDF